MTNNIKRSSLFSILLVTLFLCLTGCGNKQPLQGHVRFGDGSPLAIGTVCFVSDDYFSRGILQDDGSFRVGSEAENDGIPPGIYKVYIMGAIDEIGDGDQRSIRLLVDPKYTTPETTPLEFTIPGEKTFDFSVEPPLKK